MERQSEQVCWAEVTNQDCGILGNLSWEFLRGRRHGHMNEEEGAGRGLSKAVLKC